MGLVWCLFLPLLWILVYGFGFGVSQFCVWCIVMFGYGFGAPSCSPTTADLGLEHHEFGFMDLGLVLFLFLQHRESKFNVVMF